MNPFAKDDTSKNKSPFSTSRKKLGSSAATGFPQTPPPDPPAQRPANPFSRTRRDKWRTGIGLALGGDPNIARAAQSQREQERFGQAFNADPNQAIQFAQGAGRFDLAQQAQQYQQAQQAPIIAQQQAQAAAQQQAQADAAASAQQQQQDFSDIAVGILSLPPQQQPQAIQFYGERNGLAQQDIDVLAANPSLLQGLAAQSDEYGKALASNAENVTLGAGDRRFVQAGPQAGQELAYNRNDLGFQNDATDQYGHELDARADHARVAETRRHNQANESLDFDEFAHQVSQDQRTGGGAGGGFGIPVAAGGQGTEFQPFAVQGAQNGQGGANFINAAFGDDYITPAQQRATQGDPQNPQQDPYFNESAYAKYRGTYQGKRDAERLDEIRTSVTDELNNTGAGLQQMQNLLDAGVPIGPGADFRSKAARVPGASALPFIPSQVEGAAMERFRAISTDLALEVSQKTKGAISDREMTQFQASVPNWTQSKEGAQLMINSMNQLIERKQQYSEAASQWANTFGGLSIQNHDGLSFDQAWADYSENNPVLSIGQQDVSALSDDDLMRQLGQ